MKKILKKILIPLTKNDLVWFFLEPFSKIGTILNNFRTYIPEKEKSESRNNFEKIFFQNLVVQNGPFKGMLYPEISSIGSAIYPKLLGCYEKELWETIEYFKDKKYSEIIDIGCAEGYYAVGMALNTKNSKIYAYDTEEKARVLCNKMATLNNVSDKIIIRSKLTPEELSSFPFSGRGLIICDCEGFEKELFNKNNVKNLINCDLIIEAHDFFDINISTYLKEIFNESHDIHSIQSIDDIQKALTYNINGLEKLTLLDKKSILAEGRMSIMEWLIFIPKK
ncbi:MAG: hypothetical protein WCW54_03695 [Candidatus Paceibacterota bacterium]